MNQDDKKHIEMNNQFVQEVKMQLSIMNEKEKEDWIILQAKLLRESSYPDFIKSLNGQKKIIDMPDNEKIQKMYRKISEGEIYLEYETHYYEFDSDGNYYNDYNSWFNDPYYILPFIDLVLSSSHDLILLEEYEQALSILQQILRLEITINEAEDSEDCYPEEGPFTVVNAYEEYLLSTDRSQIATDLLYTYFMIHKNQDTIQLSEAILKLLETPICDTILPSDVFDTLLDEQCYKEMLMKLNVKIKENKIKIADMRKYSSEEYILDKKIDHENRIKENIIHYLNKK